MTDHLGRMIIIAGVVLVLVGLAVTLLHRIPLVGKLPGDIHIRRGNSHFYVPIMTSIVASVVLTFLFWIFSRISRK